MNRRLLVFALLVAEASFAYNEAIHALVTERAFARRAAWLDERLEPPGAADLDAFRRLFFLLAARDPRFAARWPTAAAFDAWELKQFLMLNPRAQVHGFDPIDLRPMSRRELLSLASRWPDDDARNRDRYLYDARRELLRSADGSPAPYDPATLDLGALTGTTSQGHAHYGLVEGPLSDDPDVLKTDPPRFAVPPTAHAYGAELSGIYTDLALLAASSGLRGGEWLAACYAGAAFHHIEDVANQIHTVQVGIYEFFRDAWVQSTLRDAKTVGGLFGERRSLRQMGARIVTNHHLFSEDLFAKRVAEMVSGRGGSAEVQAAVAGLLEGDDPEFAGEARLAMQRSRGAFGRALAQATIDRSSVEGGEVYALAYRLSSKALHDGMGHAYDGAKGDDPDEFLAPPSPARADLLRSFYRVQALGLRRAATALRLWESRFEKELRANPSAPAVERTLAIVLPYHDAAAARRASAAPAAPQRESIAWGYPIAALATLGAIAFAALRRLRATGRTGAQLQS